jgi:hypothetical protein
MARLACVAESGLAATLRCPNAIIGLFPARIAEDEMSSPATVACAF